MGDDFLWPSLYLRPLDCQSLAGPHSFPHQLGQELRIILMTPPSCHLMPRHHSAHFSSSWQFLHVREDEKKALSLSSNQHQHYVVQNINCQTLGWEFRDGNVFRVWRHCARVLYCLLSAPSYSRDFLKRWYNQMLGRYTNKIPVIPLLNLDQIVSATILTATIITRHFITWMFKI